MILDKTTLFDAKVYTTLLTATIGVCASLPGPLRGVSTDFRPKTSNMAAFIVVDLGLLLTPLTPIGLWPTASRVAGGRVFRCLFYYRRYTSILGFKKLPS